MSSDIFHDKPGFILKFEIKNQEIARSDYTLNERYCIRNVKDNWVIVTDGNQIQGMTYDAVFGCTYPDLKTEEIVVVEPYTFEAQTVNADDFLP